MESFVIAYGYDRVTMAYTCPVNAWEDQLAPGTYLLPANATFTEPPEAVAGKIRTWNGTAWTQVDIPTPPAPPEPTLEEKAYVARNTRTSLLYQSDWRVLPDLPPAKLAQASAWATYRQALRDVPQQPSFPTVITWPTPPEA